MVLKMNALQYIEKIGMHQVSNVAGRLWVDAIDL